MSYLLRLTELFLLLSLSIFWIPKATGQSVGSIRLQLIDEQQEPIAQATVYLLDTAGNESQSVRLSDPAGLVQFSGVKKGRYLLLVRHVGKEEINHPVDLLSHLDVAITLTLVDANEQLSDVVIRGKNETQAVSDHPIKAAILNTKEVRAQPATLTELMNRTAGIRIRQTGGLGSNPEVSVNGFQGRAIRYFKNGVPLDYLRDGYNVASVPIELLERVEVYKGVLPVSLGADALGGAVNLVTRHDRGSYLHTSYESASFNTHRISLNGLYSPEGGKWFAGGDFFFNHSDNDYKAVVSVTDPTTRNQYPARLRMFHNAFTSYYGELFAGIRNTRWADELRLSVGGFSLTREQQHPTLMTDPYGAVLGRQSSIVPTIRYTKSLFNEKLTLDQFLVYNTVTIGRTDTLRGRYDWFGNFTYNPLRFGETRQPSLSDVDFTNFTSRTNLAYRFSESNRLEANYVVTRAGRKGKDPYGPRFAGTDIDVLAIRTDYEKRVLGVSWESRWVDGRLTNVLMGKQYTYASAGVDTWAARPIAESERISKRATYWGIADAIKFEVNDNQFVRFSFEAANRLPQQDELFGDGIFVVPNFDLNPERSTNLNLGYRWSKPGVATFEGNIFRRKTTGLILLVPIQPPYAQYNNIDRVRGYGVELDGLVNLTQHLVLNANLTYLDLRLFGITTPIDRWKNHSRLRNTPWFFTNVGLTGNVNKIFKQNDQLKVYLHYNFMKEYYLETIPKHQEAKGFLGLFGSAAINSELIIPTQHLINIGFNYSLFSGTATLGVEVKNLLNEDIFDYYRIQRAGRSVHLKLGYTIK